MLRGVFECGTVRERGDGVVYFEVTRPDDLVERVLPFFERFPLRGSKSNDLAVFIQITACVQLGDHYRQPVSDGSSSFAVPMNRGGKGRRTDQEIYRLLEEWESSEAIRKAPFEVKG